MQDELTARQREAVEHENGPLLVLAGPGSGKTRVITRRMARLVERGVEPHRILAMTFTNKAAEEMAERVSGLVGDRQVRVSTFHRFCARLLRRRATLVGLEPNYTILDTADQRQVVRGVLSDIGQDPAKYPPARIAARISRAKNDRVTAEDFSRLHNWRAGNDIDAVVERVFPRYQQFLLQANAVDYDDLLLHVDRLLSDNPELRAELDAYYQYVLVDEYQDTNLVQYRIVRALSHDLPNLCATGDPDQSIYGWRGARLDNILEFESDYPDAVVVRLEQNFRSTGAILEAADSLIAHNRKRKIKSLVTDNPRGEPVELWQFSTGVDEADGVSRIIRAAVDDGRQQFSDFAIFYRVNSMSRQLEMALSRWGVPFQVIAGVAFYERAEVKDLLAYLRLVENPSDDAAFNRIVNKPPRKIGRVTRSRLVAWAGEQRLNLLEAAGRAAELPELKRQPVAALERFASMMQEFSLADAGSVETLLQRVIERTGYMAGWGTARTEQEIERRAVVEELVSAARQYDAAAGDERRLGEFLETTSLVADTDALDPDAGTVTLMTLHAAKGLEFPSVIILGVEQNLLPHERALRADSASELEEERRLLFVGITRAIGSLALTLVGERDRHGRSLTAIPSQFLNEIPLVLRDLSGPAAAPHPSLLPRRRRDSREDLPKPILTTGAALMNGTGEAAVLPQGFAVGMTVRHPVRGLGRVVTVSGFSRNRTVEVKFDDDEQTFAYNTRHCPLQPVG